jgi:hypothetical protein
VSEPDQLFEAVYVGCKASDEFAESAVVYAKTHLPRMAVYRANTVPTEMRLQFERIG